MKHQTSLYTIDTVIKHTRDEKLTDLTLFGPGAHWTCQTCKALNQVSEVSCWNCLAPFSGNKKSTFHLNELSPNTLHKLATLSKLTSLRIENSDLTIEDIYTIGQALPQLQALNLAGNKLGDKGVHVITQLLPHLSSLNLEGNNITSYGAEIISNTLLELTSLNLENNSIHILGIHVIANRLEKLLHLKLGRNGIGVDGVKSIAENLTQLQYLDLESNHIGDTGATLIAEKLHKLKHLELGGNNLGNKGVQAIAKSLPHLSALHLRNNKIGPDGARSIADSLTQLRSINLGGNRIGLEGTEAIANALPQLGLLDLRGNDISVQGAQEIAKSLTQLRLLRLGGNAIGDAGAAAISRSLGQLNSLHVANNNIGDYGAQSIARSLIKLTTLDLKNNRIGNAGAKAITKSLTSITSLNLKGNRISENGLRSLEKNKHLAWLNLSANNITDLSWAIPMLRRGMEVTLDGSKSGLYVSDCPIEYPPREIINQGRNAVLRYYDEIKAQGVSYLYEAKILLIGAGQSGKTSLFRRLYDKDKPLPEVDETTRGIDVYRRSFTNNSGQTFWLNIWDFGGQQIYHATHQFFLTTRSLYILLDDTKRNDYSVHDEGFKYWLEAVETLADRSPILIFQNMKGGRSKDIDESGIKGGFPNVKDIYQGDLSLPDAADSLESAIRLHVQRLPHIGQALPAQWVKLRTAIKKRSHQDPYIRIEEYFSMYSEFLPFDQQKALELSHHLHALGVFLHFQEERYLSELVFIRNEWITDAVFRIIDDETIKKNHGQFNQTDCVRIWHEDEYMYVRDNLLSLMEKFELCYELRNDSSPTWLVPQMLPASAPASLRNWAQPGDLIFSYQYKFLPRGIINRLTVRKHQLVSSPNNAWKEGVLFSKEGSHLLATVDESDRMINLHARGGEAHKLRTLIADELEELNHSFEGLRERVEKFIPCPCPECTKQTRPEFFSYKKLLDFEKRTLRTIQCQNSGQHIEVMELLKDVPLKKWTPSSDNITIPPGIHDPGIPLSWITAFMWTYIVCVGALWGFLEGFTTLFDELKTELKTPGLRYVIAMLLLGIPLAPALWVAIQRLKK